MRKKVRTFKGRNRRKKKDSDEGVGVQVQENVQVEEVVQVQEEVHVQEEEVQVQEADEVGDIVGQGEQAQQQIEVDNSGFLSDYRESDEYDSPVEQMDGSDVELVRQVGDWPMFNPNCNMFERQLEKGLRFTNPAQLRKLIRCYAVANARPIRFHISANRRLSARCAPGCPWHLWASWMRSERSFQIKKLEDEHRCVKNFSVKLANSAFISELYRDRILGNPHWKLVDMKQDVLEKYKIQVNKNKCYRAKKCALGNVDKILEEHYAKLWNYGAEIKRANPGSTVIIQGDRPDINKQGYFKRMYVCLHALKMGWIAGCRPIIGLDGCFLKGFCKGQLLSAVGRDGNNNMYPIAWAVVESENKDSWGWFLQLLMKDLGYVDGGGLTLISDKHIGLVHVVKEMYPRVVHRNCARHVYANLRKIDSGAQMKTYFWAAAKCGTPEEFDHIIALMEKENPNAAAYVLSQKKESWSRAFFTTTPVCDSVDNNMSETFNGTIIESRPKPIITMLEEIRIYCMSRLHKKKEEIEKWYDNISPRIRKILERNKENYIKWTVQGGGGDLFEVRRGPLHGFVVNLKEKICACRKWEVSGIPCEHAVAAIYAKTDDPDKYVSPWFTKAGTLKAYQWFIQPMNGENLWPKIQVEPLLPPVQRRMPGRPKNKRRKSSHEEPKRKNPHRISKKGGQNECSKCKQLGHNARTCDKRPKKAVETSTERPNVTPTVPVRKPRVPKVLTTPRSSTSNPKYKPRRPPNGFGLHIDTQTGDQYLKLGKRGRFIKKGNTVSTQESRNASTSSGPTSSRSTAATNTETPRTSKSTTTTNTETPRTSRSISTVQTTQFKPPRAKGKSPVKPSFKVATRSQCLGIRTRSKS